MASNLSSAFLDDEKDEAPVQAQRTPPPQRAPLEHDRNQIQSRNSELPISPVSLNCVIADASDLAESGCIGEMKDGLTRRVPCKEGTEVTLLANSLPQHNKDSEAMDISYKSNHIEENISDHVVRLDLSDHLLHVVFSFLDHQTLFRASLVCKQWHAAIVHEDFWTSLQFDSCRITADHINARVCCRFPRVFELHLRGALLDGPVDEALHTLRNLEVLTVDGRTLGDAFFNILVEFPFLNQLKVSDATLGNVPSREIHVRNNLLQQLHLTRCRVHRIFIRCPRLEILSLKRTSMAAALLTCPLLRVLDVASCHNLSDLGIRGAALSCPLLQSLDISNCFNVSNNTLREIAAGCTDLQILDASNCPNISLEAVRMPMLVDLKLHNCESLNASSMDALSHCSLLETLQLDFCWLLTSVILDLPRLRYISLVDCHKIVNLNLSCPALAMPNVSSCPFLDRVDIKSTALQKLVLEKQQSLKTITLQCLHLTEVELRECQLLTNSICEVFSVGGGCPMLNTLIIARCNSLTNVNLTSTSLRTLCLNFCRGVTSLQLACPTLKNLSLDGCDRLQRASFCPVGLQYLDLGICPYLSQLEIQAPQLSLLELKGCRVLSQVDINCPQLQSLDASFCSLFNDHCLAAATVACPSIVSLVLMSCDLIGRKGFLALQRLSNLILLDLSYTFLTDLLPIIDYCPQLKVLKLQACKYLDNAALVPLHRRRALPRLCELDLSYGTLCQSAIEDLLAFCLHLTHLNLSGCMNMKDIDWRSENGKLHNKQNIFVCTDNSVTEKICSSRSLQILNCVGCHIKKVVIPTSAYCVNLCSLNLSQSAYLNEVSLACCNLRTLNLSNCSALETLQLDCPRLTSLWLQACGIKEHELERAMQSCQLVETLDVRSCPKISLRSITKLQLSCSALKRIFSNA